MLLERFYSKKRAFSKGFCKPNYQKIIRSDGSSGCETRGNFYYGGGGIFIKNPIVGPYFFVDPFINFTDKFKGLARLVLGHLFL